MNSELLAAIFGAIVAGGIQTIIAVCDRRRERDSMVSAIAVEVHAICELIRFRKYIAFLSQMIDEMEADESLIYRPVIDIRQNYFFVFEAIAAKIGQIPASDSRKIVRFYALSRSAIDSAYRDGAMADNDDRNVALENCRQLRGILREILRVGDEVVQIPKNTRG